MSAPTRLESIYLTTLAEQLGLPCEVEAPGFLLLRVDGGRECFVLLDPDEPDFLRFGTTEPWPVGTRRAWAEGAAEHVNRRCPGVKATLADDHDVTVLAVEMVVAAHGCLPTPSLVAAVLDRMTGALLDALEVFGDEVVLSGLDDDAA